MCIKKLILSFIIFCTSISSSASPLSFVCLINQASATETADEPDECDDAISDMDDECSDDKMKTFGAEELQAGETSDPKEEIDRFRRANSKYISVCEKSVSECSNVCKGDSSGENACKSVKDGKLASAKKAQAAANKSSQGAGEMAAILGGLVPLLAMLFNKNKKTQPAACTGTACTAAISTQPTNTDSKVSATGGLVSSGYRPYAVGAAAQGAAEIGSAKGDLAKSKGGKISSASDGSNSRGGAASIGFSNGSGSGRSPASSAVGVASVAPDEHYDTNLGEGFYSGGSGSSSSGGGSIKSEDGNRRATTAAAVSAAPGVASAGAVSSYPNFSKSSEFNRILDKAKKALRLPSSLNSMDQSTGDAYGDNFSRIHERYRLINSNESWEDQLN